MKNKENIKIKILSIIVIIIVLLCPIVFGSSGYFMHILFLIAFKAYMATSWNILSGYSGQISLGHAMYLGIGAYCGTILFTRLNINPWMAMIASGTMVSALSVIIGLPLFRLRNAFFAISTNALIKVASLLAIYFRGLTGGSMGTSIPIHKMGFAYQTFEDKVPYVYIAYGMLALVLCVAWRVYKSKLGYQLFALRDDHDAAASLGVNTLAAKLKIMAISTFMVAMGGSFYAHYILYVDPIGMFDPQLSMDMTIMANLGGIGTMFGPVLGAILLVPIDALLRSVFGGGATSGLDIVIYGCILIVIVWFCPGGLWPLFNKLLYKLNNKKEEIQTFAYNALRTKAELEHAKHIGHDLGEKSGKPILEIRNVCMQFGGLKAVNDVSFDVMPGQIFGIIGPNGAGKTTLFNAITGYVKADSGTIKYSKKVLSKNIRPHQLAGMGLTRTFQSVRPFTRMTIADNVMIGAVKNQPNIEKAKEITNEILKIVGLEVYANRLPDGLTVAEQKRLDMARTLAMNPKILMLDEPMAGLTENEVNDLIEIVRGIAKRGITIIIIEHVMHAVMKLCERIIVLDHGVKISEGTPKEVTSNEKVIEVYLGEKYNG
ncbi:branched-chain amino acid ABC transporter ATP-binding protein/permease [Petroclostridium sp. X23]|uniref:branched-chain amino acid ABC transporter ATP-binding protein/permease n=1 Tax=Petroclostridium sp. X23 TaxID=3045146 RepID=UPI0024ADF333|nr:branched-chain amino acid ABC transporter ATP-binding protein/permease [Petroclostridium sp. X23]WHH60920.1 branched-chain amino acid ABC transporter ATP-binding protein/permease [Petroclostridium sp. X23]